MLRIVSWETYGQAAFGRHCRHGHGRAGRPGGVLCRGRQSGHCLVRPPGGCHFFHRPREGADLDALLCPLRRRPPAAGMPEHIAAALCYLLGLITGVLFLVVEPYRSNRLIRFHAFQSVFLSAAWFVVWLAAVILLPGLGFFLVPLLALGFLALWLYLISSTYQGRKVVLPLIGLWAARQAG